MNNDTYKLAAFNKRNREQFAHMTFVRDNVDQGVWRKSYNLGQFFFGGGIRIKDANIIILKRYKR